MLALGAWLLKTGFETRAQLDEARSHLRSMANHVADGDMVGARKEGAKARQSARRARKATNGFLWSTVSAVPVIGSPMKTVSGLSDTVADLTGRPLDQALTLADELNPKKLRSRGDRIELKPLIAARPVINQLLATTTAAADDVRKLPSSTWASSVDDARASAIDYLDELVTVLGNAQDASRVMPTMLGDTKPQRYFVGVQNEAEARGTGGLPGAFMILEADHGRLTFSHFGSDSELIGMSSGLKYGPDFQNSYGGAAPENSYQNSNMSPHFPYAANIWAHMWENASGEHVNGAIAIDPTAMSYLLSVTGPATTSTGERVTSDNIVALTQSTVYERFSDQTERKAYLTDIARAVSERILDAKASATQLVRAVETAGDQRRILMWSADPDIENVLRPTRFSGFIPDTSAPFAGLVVVNEGGNKLDYYLERSLQWSRTGCGNSRLEQVSITLTNAAPAGGLSPYVTSRTDEHSYPVRPGDNRLRVSYFATKGATLQSATIDGKTIQSLTQTEVGHPVFVFDVEMPRGRTRQLDLVLQAPSGEGEPIVLTQPLVRPLQFSSLDEPCPTD